MTTTGSMLIDGEWVPASNGATYAVPNPATEEIIGTRPTRPSTTCGAPSRAARRAFDDGPWPRTTREDRARALLRIADGDGAPQGGDAPAARSPRPARRPSRTPSSSTRRSSCCANYADLARSFAFEEMLPALVSQTPMGPQVNNSMVYHQPVGVCGLIPTWNFPLFVTVQKLGPALATGCTMVFKPSPYGPLDRSASSPR